MSLIKIFQIALRGGVGWGGGGGGTPLWGGGGGGGRNSLCGGGIGNFARSKFFFSW